MRVAPQEKTNNSCSRPESTIGRFRIEKIEELGGHHGLNIGGIYVSSNCNAILMVMAIIFVVGGVIFTVISYRPRDKFEDMDSYRDRQESEDTFQVKIVGPIFVIIGLVMMLFSILLLTISWILRK